jgi:hypothetical protein
MHCFYNAGPQGEQGTQKRNMKLALMESLNIWLLYDRIIYTGVGTNPRPVLNWSPYLGKFTEALLSKSSQRTFLELLVDPKKLALMKEVWLKGNWSAAVNPLIARSKNRTSRAKVHHRISNKTSVQRHYKDNQSVSVVIVGDIHKPHIPIANKNNTKEKSAPLTRFQRARKKRMEHQSKLHKFATPSNKDGKDQGKNQKKNQETSKESAHVMNPVSHTTVLQLLSRKRKRDKEDSQ